MFQIVTFKTFLDSPNAGDDNIHDLDSSIGKDCVKCVGGVVNCFKKCHDSDHKAKCTTKCVALKLPKCAMCVTTIIKCVEECGGPEDVPCIAACVAA